MDQHGRSVTRNPFTPGFGEVPALVAGRNEAFASFVRGIESDRVQDRMVLVSGLRGTGKTVLLTMFKQAATRRGWQVLTLHTAQESLREEARAGAAYLLRSLDPEARSARVVSAGGGVLGVSASASSQVIDKYEDEEEPLGELLARLARLAARDGGGLFIAIDEIQSVNKSQMYEIAQEIQDLVSKNLRVAFAAAGVHGGVEALLTDAKTTFLRRAKPLVIGNIAMEDAVEVIRLTVAETQKSITPEAAVRAAELAQGYPYLIQSVGARAWDRAGDADIIEIEDVDGSRADLISDMIRSVHAPALRALSPRKLQYLMAMLADHGPSRTGQIAQRMGVSTGDQSQYRARLIEDGLIQPAARGMVEFAVPYLREALQERRSGTPLADQGSGILRTREL